MQSVNAALRAQGITEEYSLEELETAFGASANEIFQSFVGVDLDTLVSLVLGESSTEELLKENELAGKYRLELEKLHMTYTPDAEISETDYMVYTLEDDTLTLKRYAGETMLNMFFPVKLQRVG